MALEILSSLPGMAWELFAKAMENDGVFLGTSLLLAGLFALVGGRGARTRLAHMASVMLLCFLLGLLLKQGLAVARPCDLGQAARIACPTDYSLPSIHTAVSFGLALAVLGLSVFPLALLWALLIAASRLWLGVHTLTDIEAGLALAVLAMALVDALRIGEPVLRHSNVMKKKLSNLSHNEIVRKLVQALLGIGVAFYAMVMGVGAAAMPVAWALLLGLVLFHLKHRKVGLPVIDAMLDWLERPGAAPGYGALTFFAGLLTCLVFLPQALAVSMVLVLSVCDGMAGIAGRWAARRAKENRDGMHLHHPLPHNPNKSVLGSLAFVVCALPVYFLAGWVGVAAALLAAVAESLPLGVDDNLLIPWSGVLVVILARITGIG